MSVVEEKTVAIIGGGLVGSLAALHLANRGYHVKVFERREDIRQAASIEGHRSINLALSVRGLSALRMVGLEQEVLQTVIPMRARMVHPLGKEARAQPYGTFGECINSVDRRLLNKKLLDHAEALPNVELRFDSALESLDPEKGKLIISDRYYDWIHLAYLFCVDAPVRSRSCTRTISWDATEPILARVSSS